MGIAVVHPIETKTLEAALQRSMNLQRYSGGSSYMYVGGALPAIAEVEEPQISKSKPTPNRKNKTQKESKAGGGWNVALCKNGKQSRTQAAEADGGSGNATAEAAMRRSSKKHHQVNMQVVTRVRRSRGSGSSDSSSSSSSSSSSRSGYAAHLLLLPLKKVRDSYIRCCFQFADAEGLPGLSYPPHFFPSHSDDHDQDSSDLDM